MMGLMTIPHEHFYDSLFPPHFFLLYFGYITPVYLSQFVKDMYRNVDRRSIFTLHH